MEPDRINKIEALVARFRDNEVQNTRSGSPYNETELRTDFLNEFFEILGWDVLNKKGLAKPFREVVLEANASDEDKSQRPDYEFRLNGERKFFLEAKKPSVDISTNQSSVYQVRRYGWTAGLSVSVLSNFKHLVIYETITKPEERDDVRVSRVHIFGYEEYVSRFDEISALLSRQAVLSGEFDKVFRVAEGERRGELSFDSYFLKQIERWRILLAQDITANNRTISIEDLNYLIQVFVNRIVFLRICEDRNLEKYGTLLGLDKEHAIEALMKCFHQADKKYNSGLFDFIRDKLTPSVVISNEVLISIVADLYYPNSPYAFSVVDPKILGDIYEQFLAKVLIRNEDGELVTEYRPEFKISNGIFTTPAHIVNEIVSQTFRERMSLKDFDSERPLTVADIACGSGIFLLGAYDFLLKERLEYYIKTGKSEYLSTDDYGDKHLTVRAKKSILSTQIFGVDIDERAVEVTKFSLLLKLLEDVTPAEIQSLVNDKEKILPSLEKNILSGNSLVDSTYFDFRDISEVTTEELSRVKAFNWGESFPSIFRSGGFDIIVGNPPYIKIQHMAHFSATELEFYQSKYSHYETAAAKNFDKYQLFVERAYSLLSEDGCLGYIIPHKFMITAAGSSLREFLAATKGLRHVTHFGENQVFGTRATTYTCIIILQKTNVEEFCFERVNNLDEWMLRGDGKETSLFPNSILGVSPWIFSDKYEEALVSQICSVSTDSTLGSVADIFVGIQTSADNIYFLSQTRVDDDYVYFTDKAGNDWKIEKGITREGILDQAVVCEEHVRPNKKVIFPYVVVDGQAVLIDEDRLRTEFPFAFAYLSHHKDKLRARSMPNAEERWYQFGRSQSLGKFDSEKLVIKNPATFATASYDSENVLFSGGGNGPYYGIRPRTSVDIYFLMALLNHPILDRWVKMRSSIFRGDYYSFGKQFLDAFPVPADSEYSSERIRKICNYWERIVELDVNVTSSPTEKVENQRQQQGFRFAADNLVFELYGVDKQEFVKNYEEKDTE